MHKFNALIILCSENFYLPSLPDLYGGIAVVFWGVFSSWRLYCLNKVYLYGGVPCLKLLCFTLGLMESR